MSAVAGIFEIDGSAASRDLVAEMMRVLAHRASGAGVCADGPVALGQGIRLLEAGREIVMDRPRHLALVADARLDNREELAGVLGAAREASDGDIILAAYERWGGASAARLAGDFAFALWDGRRGELFCARDVMGVKPFYYTQSAGRFAFASEPKALLALPGVSRDLDDEQIALFLGWRPDDRVGTVYKAVRRLPAAHSMVVSARGVRSASYWNLEDARDVRFADAEQYVEAFRERFASAVAVRLDASQPIAAALSGGLDSSSIVCEARRQLAARGAGASDLHAISLVFPDAPESDRRRLDERVFAERVTATGGLQAHAVRGDHLSPLMDLSRVLRHVDEPYFTPNLYLHWAMFGAAQHAGARVFLDGFDGDTTVSHGFGRLNSLARAGAWDSFESEVRAFAGHRQVSPSSVLPHFGLPYLADLARGAHGIAWYRAARQLVRRFGLSRRDVVVRHGLAPIFSPVLRGARRAVGRPSTAESALFHPEVTRAVARAADRAGRGAVGAREREMHLEGLSQPAYQWTLEIADKSAAAFGIEPRYPFFDRRLIEFCVGLPEEQKFAGGWPRLLFRRAMEGVLPREIQWRSTKADLSSNFRRRFLAADQATVERTDLGVLAPYLDVRRLRERLQRYRSADASGASDAEGCLLFRATVLAAWLGTLRGSARIETAAPQPHAPVAA